YKVEISTPLLEAGFKCGVAWHRICAEWRVNEPTFNSKTEYSEATWREYNECALRRFRAGMCGGDARAGGAVNGTGSAAGNRSESGASDGQTPISDACGK